LSTVTSASQDAASTTPEWSALAERQNAVEERQRALGKNLLLLAIVPIVLAAILLVMFLALINRLTDVEVAIKIVNIERIITNDRSEEGAIHQYEDLAKTHRSAPLLARLARLYFQVNRADKDKALAMLEEAKRLDSNNLDIYRTLTYIYTSSCQGKSAIAAGKRALELNEYDANTYNNLGWILARSKEPDVQDLVKAQANAERAVELTKKRHSDFLDTLAEVHLHKGEKDLARQLLQEAQKVAPGEDTDYYAERLSGLAATQCEPPKSEEKK